MTNGLRRYLLRYSESGPGVASICRLRPDFGTDPLMSRRKKETSGERWDSTPVGLDSRTENGRDRCHGVGIILVPQVSSCGPHHHF